MAESHNASLPLHARGRRYSMEEGKRSDAKAIPVEVWMAAKAHRKTNFFGAAALGCEGGESIVVLASLLLWFGLGAGGSLSGFACTY